MTISTGRAVRTSNSVSIRGYARETDLSVTSSATQTAALTEGSYDIYNSSTTLVVYVKIFPTANDVTTSTGYPIPPNTTINFDVFTNDKIGAIAASGTTAVLIHRVG